MIKRPDLIKKALAHYDRMIKWAKKQPQKDEVCELGMRNRLGEYWQALDCAYCQNYKSCDDCPLRGSKIGERHYRGCCSDLHGRMDGCLTWKSWITAAKKVREYIKKHG